MQINSHVCLFNRHRLIILHTLVILPIRLWIIRLQHSGLLDWLPTTQNIDQILQLEPELVFGTTFRPVCVCDLETTWSTHGREQDLRALDADDGGGVFVLGDFVARFAGVGFDVLHAFDCHTEGADTVHGGWFAALLEVTGYCGAGLEAAFGFFLDHVGDDLGGVGLRGGFVAQDDLTGAIGASVGCEARPQKFNVSC